MAAPKGLLSFYYHITHDFTYYKQFKKDRTQLYLFFQLSQDEQDAIENALSGDPKMLGKLLRKPFGSDLPAFW